MSEKANLKKVLGFWDLMGMAIGQIIGSGVMVLTGITIGMTGRGVVIAYMIAAVLTIVAALPVAALGSAIPSTGGLYTYCKKLLSPKVGFFYLSLLVAGQLVIAMFALSFAQYAAALIPGASVRVIAFIALTFFFITNLIGVKSAARAGNIMVIILLAGLAVFIVFGLPQVDYSKFTAASNLFPNGAKAFMLSFSLLSFATGGAKYISECGDEMKNPNKDIPRVIVISTILVAVFYACIAVVASGVLPIDQVANKPLTEVAKAILPAPLYVFFVIGGGMFALATTLNATFAWATKGMLMACADGWLPKSFGNVNAKFGTPHKILTFFFIVGAVPILTGISLKYIAMLGNGVSLIYDMFPVIAATQLIKKFPTEYANAPFKLKASTMNTFVVLAIIVLTVQAYLCIGDLNVYGWIMLAAYMICSAVYANYKGDKLAKLPDNNTLSA